MFVPVLEAEANNLVFNAAWEAALNTRSAQAAILAAKAAREEADRLLQRIKSLPPAASQAAERRLIAASREAYEERCVSWHLCQATENEEGVVGALLDAASAAFKAASKEIAHLWGGT